MNKSNFKQIFLTLALLITAATGAWAQEETLLTTITATGQEQASYSTENIATVSFSSLPSTATETYGSSYLAAWGWWGYGWTATVTAAEGYTITKCIFYDDADRTATDSEAPFVVETTEEDKTPQVNGTPILADQSKGIKKIEVYGYSNATNALDVTLNDANTVATMAMPASDVTVTYELVRDLAQQVTFGGIPTGDGLVVKKGGTAYEFATAPTFTLTDALADNADIISAEGITLTVGKMVEPEGLEGYRQFDEATAVSLADFLANPQPGIYKMKATANADGPYDGTIYSAEFTTVEKYDLTIQPADEYSKDKLSEVTVAGTAQTLDADGKATVPNVAPGAEVKLKAKTGYVIEKVEAKKKSAAVNVTAITLNKTETTIPTGQTETLSVSSVTPDDATDQTVTWSSDNDAVATVDDNGLVTAVAFGTANITATANDGSGVTATCAVTVSKVVTINQSDWGSGSSFTKDGVTVSAGMIDPDDGNLMSGGSFSTTLGNFTKIVVTAADCNASGTGWSGSGSSMTWEGTPASTVSFSGDFMSMGMGQTTIVCTIVPAN